MPSRIGGRAGGDAGEEHQRCREHRRLPVEVLLDRPDRLEPEAFGGDRLGGSVLEAAPLGDGGVGAELQVQPEVQTSRHRRPLLGIADGCMVRDGQERFLSTGYSTADHDRGAMTVVDTRPSGGPALTPEQITLVQTTIGASAPRVDALAADFYVRLFAADPSLVALFSRIRPCIRASSPTSWPRSRRHPSLGRVRRRGRALGCRHRHYGVGAGHYRTAGVRCSTPSPSRSARSGPRRSPQRGGWRTTSSLPR